MTDATKTNDDVQWWDVARLLKRNCDYNIAFGGRNDGKTTSILGHIIRRHMEDGSRGLYVRYLQEQFLQGRASDMMRSLEYAGERSDVNLIEQWTDGAYTTTKYQNRAWHLGRQVENADGVIETLYAKEPFCYAKALQQVGNDKGATPANVRTVYLDEFIDITGKEQPGIVSKFMHLLVTSVRGADGVQVFMTANTVTWNNGFYEHFGITRDVQGMKMGEIRCFETQLEGMTSTLAVERVAPARTKTGGRKPSDRYFIWGQGATSRMIIDGGFEVPDFPTWPHPFTSMNVKFTYWLIEPDKRVIRARLIKADRELFVFVDRVPDHVYKQMASPRDITYSLEFTSKRNHYVNPSRAYAHPATGFMVDALGSNHVFFEDNVAGTDFVYFLDRARQRSVLSP